MGYTRGIAVQYQYQGVGIGIVLVVVKNHLYPIPDQYQRFTGNAAIINKEIPQKIYYQAPCMQYHDALQKGCQSKIDRAG